MAETMYRFSIDRGGTFTDVYAEVPGDPGFRVVKLLSEDPAHYPDAPLEGIRRILQDVSGIPLPMEKFDTSRVEWVRMGTTVATNALLERKGEPCALLITKGFGDLLRIGKQNRPDLFDLKVKKPDPLYETIVEVEERVRVVDKAEGREDINLVQGISGELIEILQAPDLDRIEKDLQPILERGIRSLAVVLMHSWTWPDHELQIGALAEKMGFAQVSLSSRVMPRVKIVERGQTCCVDAYLTPAIRGYLEGFRSRFGNPKAKLLFMQSDGGLVPAELFKGNNAILSGPAGGVVGYASTAFEGANPQPVIGFDMGGTSTDVSRFDGEYELALETEVAGIHLQAPQLNIKTVAAGGGSRLFFKNGMFVVGPESSGAHPGPVCYRKNGALSITDANLVLGRINPEFFPKIFGPGQDEPLDPQTAREEFEKLVREINNHSFKGRDGMSVEEAASGFVRVANETMARAVREISVARGHDVRNHVLACFGGAGGQHACAIARLLGISTIKIHRFAGILSAYGMGLADLVKEIQGPASGSLDDQTLPDIEKRLDAMASQAREKLAAQGILIKKVRVQRYLNLRYQGTDTSIMVPEPTDKNFARAFESIHKREFGFGVDGRNIVVDDLRVRATGSSGPAKKKSWPGKSGPTKPEIISRCYFDEGWRQTPIFNLGSLGAMEEINGPAIIINDTSTIVVEPDCAARITEFGDVEIEVAPSKEKWIAKEVDPIQLAIFSAKFASIAEQMGRILQRTAISTNIKERQDFSCAVFGPDGSLVANAPHQPVHLGSMGEAVRWQIKLRGDDLREGDVLVSNHPAAGGTHLPDITVITPVMEQGKPVFFVASRGHHADIGGISPGSMPPFSNRIEEEGVCIKSVKLVENGVFNEKEITELLTRPPQIERASGDPPISGTRALKDNISDLKAQVAANRKGIELLQEMAGQYSLEVVHAYMSHIRDHAETAVRSLLRKFYKKTGKDTSLTASEFMDDGTQIQLTLSIKPDGSALFDFSGTGPQVSGNCNAPLAVTHSAVLYCLRCLLQEDIPLNQGCLVPVEFRIEEGSLLSPSETAAVAAGNVLTSQRIVDVVLKAFGAAAASQGCMNNLTFGDERFGYYETIGGGAGAGPGWDGQSGVHTHMTNTRITDPEILEQRYPVLLREFSLRKGSGGKGKFRGGDGLVREIEFLKPLNVAILSERRVYPPYGLECGYPGERGKNLFIKKDGTVIDLGGKNEVHADPGDRIRILTPGGGGYGK